MPEPVKVLKEKKTVKMQVDESVPQSESILFLNREKVVRNLSPQKKK